MNDKQEKIFCPVYEVWNSRYACARRYENANQVTGNPYDRGGAGSGDLACRECEKGKQMHETGEGKKEKQTAVIRPKEAIMGEVPMAEKKCNKCLETKQLSEFTINRATTDGLDYYCKQCRAEERRNKKRGGKPAEQPKRAGAQVANKKAHGAGPASGRVKRTELTAEAQVPSNKNEGRLAPQSSKTVKGFLLHLALLLERFNAEMVCDGAGHGGEGITVKIGGETAFIGQPRLPRPGEDVINNSMAEE